MKTIVGACLSQFHGDLDNYEFLIAYSDGREIGNVLLKQVAQVIAKDMAEQVGSNDHYVALVAAAKRAAEVMERHIYPKPDVGPDHPYSIFLALQEAIAKAEGRS